jgi:hypothetical protein
MPDSLIQPIELAAAAAFALFVAFVLVESTIHPLPSLEPAVAPSNEPAVSTPRRRRLRLAAISALALMLSVGVGGCVFVNVYEPLRATGPVVGSGPLYLGTVPATFGGLDEVEFAAASGGDMRMEFTLANSGDFPLTVVGIEDPMTAYSSMPSWEGSIFQSGTLSPASGGSANPTSNRFEIPAHASTRVVVSISFACIGITPTPTLAPGRSPSPWVALAAQGYGISSIGLLPVDYEMLGLQHRGLVTLPAYISWAAIDMSGCGGSQNQSVLPSGVSVTPVPSITYP